MIQQAVLDEHGLDSQDVVRHLPPQLSCLTHQRRKHERQCRGQDSKDAEVDDEDRRPSREPAGPDDPPALQPPDDRTEPHGEQTAHVDHEQRAADAVERPQDDDAGQQRRDGPGNQAVIAIARNGHGSGRPGAWGLMDEKLVREGGDVVADHLQLVERREVDEAKRTAIGRIAEPGAVHAENACRPEQSEHEVFVGAAGWKRDLRHHIEGGVRGHAPHPRNRRQPRDGQVGPLPKGVDERALKRAIACERGLDRVLHRARAAQPAVCQFLDRSQRIVEPIRPADGQPAGAPSWRKIGLRQRRKRNDGRIGREAAEERRRSVE